MISQIEKLLDDELQSSRKSRYLNGLKSWVDKIEPDLLVTLTFKNSSTTENFATNTLKCWLKIVSQSIYGRYSKNKIVVIPFIERNSSNGIHFHLLIKEPVTQRKVNIKEIFKAKWLKLDGAGYASFKAKSSDGNEQWFKPITDQNTLVEYLSKQTNNQQIDTLLVELINTTET